jgi:putative peptidoglycan lipid II flippase
VTLGTYGVTLLQQVVYGRVLGVNPETDALAASLAWATGIAGLVGTTFVSVMVPAYLQSLKENAAHARRLYRTATAISLSVGLAAALVTFVFSSQLAGLLLPGSDSQTIRILERLLPVSAPLIPLWIGVAATIGLANSHGRYSTVAASAIVPSLLVIAALLSPSQASGELTLVGYVAGAVIQLAVVLAIVRRWLGDLLPSPSWPDIRPLIARMIPIASAFVVLAMAALAARAIGSLGGPGDAAVVDYANRLVSAAETALLSAVLAVMLTAWSLEFSADRRFGDGDSSVDAALRSSIGLLVPGAVALAIMAPDLVAVLFRGGRFTDSNTQTVANFLRWMAPGVAVHAFLMLALRAQLAQGAMWSVTGMAVVHLVVFVAVGLATHQLLGVAAVGLAYTVGWVCAASVTLATVHVPGRNMILVWEAVRSLAASACAGALTFVALGVVGAVPLIRLVAGTVAFGVSGLAFGSLLRVGFVGSLVAQVLSARRRPAQP